MTVHETALTVGSLFSGYGGLEMGISLAFNGATPAYVADSDPYASRILEHHYPDARNLGDVTSQEARNHTARERVDILAGGSPCQGFSTAGKKRGAEDPRSGLYRTFLEHAAASNAPIVVWENVPGVKNMLDTTVGKTVLENAVTVLENNGYQVEWTELAASEVSAPHKRRRIFLTAAKNEGFDLLTRCAPPTVKPGVGERKKGLLPTPTAGMYCGPQQNGRKGGLSLQAAIHQDRHLECAEAIDKWEQATGRPRPAPKDSQGRLNPLFPEWMMGLPAGHVTNPHIGLSRKRQLVAIGNGVVPQQAAEAIRINAATILNNRSN